MSFGRSVFEAAPENSLVAAVSWAWISMPTQTSQARAFPVAGDGRAGEKEETGEETGEETEETGEEEEEKEEETEEEEEAKERTTRKPPPTTGNPARRHQDGCAC